MSCHRVWLKVIRDNPTGLCLRQVWLSFGHLLQKDEADSEAEVSDADEDAEAKAKRLAFQLQPREGALPTSASGRTAASAGPPARNAEQNSSLQLQKGSNSGKKLSKPDRRGDARHGVSANGSAQMGGLLQSGSASAETASSAEEHGHEAYRPDILAHVARKQREDLLDAKTGVTQSHVPCCRYASALLCTGVDLPQRTCGRIASHGWAKVELLFYLCLHAQTPLRRMELQSSTKGSRRHCWPPRRQARRTGTPQDVRLSSRRPLSGCPGRAMPSRPGPRAQATTRKGEPYSSALCSVSLPT